MWWNKTLLCCVEIWVVSAVMRHNHSCRNKTKHIWVVMRQTYMCSGEAKLIRVVTRQDSFVKWWDKTCRCSEETWLLCLATLIVLFILWLKHQKTKITSQTAERILYPSPKSVYHLFFFISMCAKLTAANISLLNLKISKQIFTKKLS